jgi:hypothetical protein
MNRFDPTAPKSTASEAALATAEQRFRLIRRIKARVRADRALGFSDAEIVGNIKAIHERELAKRIEELKESGRLMATIARRATSEALAEKPMGSLAFDSWLADTISKNRPFVPMSVIPERKAPKE